MKKIVILFFLAILFSCISHSNKNDSKVKRFKLPEVPVVVTDPIDRANYLTTHYWDNFDFVDTAFLSVDGVVEQAISNYIDIMTFAIPEVSRNSITSMLVKAEVDSVMYNYFVDIFDKYLYDPNSPLRNEELYIAVLNQMLASTRLSDIEKIRPSMRLDMALKNRVGESAVDFVYTLANGAKGSLYSIKADYVIMFINNPDCNACLEVKTEIKSSQLLTEMINRGELKVLAIYPDEDIAAWENHQHSMPTTWINGYDKELYIRDQELYDLKAIPTLYLMDKQKKVLLKDAFSVVQIEQWFTLASQ